LIRIAVLLDKNGIVFKNNDIQSLKNAMIYMLEHKNQIKSLGQYAQLSIAKWSFDEISTAIESTMYNKI